MTNRKEGDLVGLTKTQLQLLGELRARLSKPMQAAVENHTRMIDELSYIRITEFAKELGINLETENWEFNPETNAFVFMGMANAEPTPPKAKPTKTTVKKRGVPKEKD